MKRRETATHRVQICPDFKNNLKHFWLSEKLSSYVSHIICIKGTRLGCCALAVFQSRSTAHYTLFRSIAHRGISLRHDAHQNIIGSWYTSQDLNCSLRRRSCVVPPWCVLQQHAPLHAYVTTNCDSMRSDRIKTPRTLCASRERRRIDPPLITAASTYLSSHIFRKHFMRYASATFHNFLSLYLHLSMTRIADSRDAPTTRILPT